QEPAHIHPLPLRQAGHDARPRPRRCRPRLTPALPIPPVPLKSPKNENFFPMVGKFTPVFPTIGKNFRRFSNDWKKFSRFFQ
ncbi:MAG: hypothetical protein IKO01_10110, partial [Kiritimatiellae bacterium]|nr:hypothetical protein [Kiritimatiellia bacterium]